MKKMMISLLLIALIFVSCEKKAIPTFADTKSLANAIWEEADFDMSSVYAENFENHSAFMFGLSNADCTACVKNGVILRPAIDDRGQMLCLLEMKSAADARKIADKISHGYEWAPCDNAEKLAVVCAEEYLMVFKSSKDDVEKAIAGFRRLSGGKLAYRKDLVNVG